jgi:long-chain acyl-CoA synthetase
MIRKYYKGRVLLITGGTGFVGSALIAKVLADLGDEVQRIYVLIRPRRRADGGEIAPAERLQQLYETSLFARLRLDPARWARLRDKVVPVTIDERRADLGLSAADRHRLISEVDTIFNSAATVVFDEPLDISVQANVGGPQALLELAQASERRIDFVHVSTAYVNGQRGGRIADEALPTDRDMQQVMDAAAGAAVDGGFDPEAEIVDCQDFCAGIRDEASSEDFIRGLKRDVLRQYPRSGGRKMTRTRLEGLVADRRAKWIDRRLVEEGMRRGKARGWTDVYTYTKAMGEQLLSLRRGSVPLVIVRPSIIESSLTDPEPGWITGLKVMDPLLAAYGRGLIPDFPARPDVVIDVIPVDMVVNGCLAAATRANVDHVEVFHIASGGENPVRIGEMFDSVRAHYQRLPMTDMGDEPPPLPVWSYPSLRTFRAVFHLKHLYPIRIREWLLNHVPGRKASPRQKRLLRSMRVRLQRVLYYIDIYSPYTHLDCQFQTKRTRALWEALPADERETFNLDVMRIEWQRYIEDIHLPGMRRNVLRDEFAADTVLPEAPEEPGVEEARLQDEDEVQTIPDLVRSAAARFPEVAACEIQRHGEWSILTYAQLLEQVERRAAGWQASGLTVGDRIVLVGENGPDWVVSYLSASFLGATVVPVCPQTPADEIARIAVYTRAAALVATEEHLTSTRADGTWKGLCLDWWTGAPAGSEAGPTPAPAGPFNEPDIDGQMAASIIFTSGVRVDPRGVVLTHENFITDLLGLSELQRLDSEDHLLSLLPLHHGLEFTGGLLLTLWSGATTTYFEAPLNSRRILETIRDRNVTAILAVPRILKILMDRVLRLDGDDGGPQMSVLRQLRLIVSGGAPLDGDLFDTYARAGLTIHDGYGLTEAGPIVTVTPRGGSRRGSVGLPLPGVEVRIDGASTDSPDGEGEILVRGPTVMRGYLDRAELTAQVLRDGWLHTGDIGRLDADGYLTITGRRRDLIVTGAGKNVYPAEVEDLYADLPYVAELAVVGVPSARTLGEQVHGVAVLSGAARGLDIDEVADLIRQRAYAVSRDLPTYQRIAQVHVWQRPLPRLDDGRVDRMVLRAELEGGGNVADSVDIGDSLAPWERDIYQRVSDLSGLALSEVVAHADAPLDTLINSLMAAELAAGLRQAEARVVFERTHTSLRQLLDDIGSQGSAANQSQDAIQDTGTYWAESLADARQANPRDRNRMAAIVGRLRVRWRDVQITGTGKLPAERPYLLAASATGNVSLASVLAALARHTDNVCLLVEEQQDLRTDSCTSLSRWLLNGIAERVVLADFPRLEDGLVAAATQVGLSRPLLLFPEGFGAVAGRGPGAFKSGIGLLALELGVSIVPLHVNATDGGTKILVGDAIEPAGFAARQSQLTSYEVYREIAADVRARLRDLSLMSLRDLPPTQDSI